MRLIELKERHNGHGPTPGPVHDHELLLMAAKGMLNSDRGMNYDEACKTYDLVKLMERDKSKLQLEEADWAYLCQKWRAFNFNSLAIDPLLMRDLGKALVEAEEVKVVPAPTAE